METDWGKRLRARMEAKGLSMRTLSMAAGLGNTFVRDMLERSRVPSIDKFAKIAKVLDTTVADLLGEQPDAQRFVPLMGYVGAGQAVYPIDDGGGEMAEAPPEASESTVAVRIKGDSMLPAFEDGWLLYYSRHLPPHEMINRRCVVQLADGRILVKTIRRGAAQDVWTLTSTNAADIEDVVVEWAAPIDWIRPR
ncbi:XRE family transcriptional regulator [Mesorhizobium sp. KR1-2]|uniref:XRE family transcriptional regulator n=1 Tax=Mesorhizobium sp. KR1-2 TaxID=3156609 RepID=UPI0032B5AC75